ncbi:hypothetical protein ACROYT_G023235 [Oculina patagonica]
MKMSDALRSRSTLQIVAESFPFVTASVIGLLANGLLCVAIFKKPSLRHHLPTATYITALAIADMLSNLNALIFPSATLLTGKWVYGRVGCDINGFSTFSLLHISVGTVALIAVNRYIKVTSPSRYRKIFNGYYSAIFVVILWAFVTVLVAIPVFLGRAEFKFTVPYAQCSVQKARRYFAVTSGGFIVTSFAVTVICYRKVHKAMKQIHLTLDNIPENEPNQNSHAMTATASGFVTQENQNSHATNHLTQYEIKSTRAFLVIMLTFLCFWCPVLLTAFAIKIFDKNSRLAGTVATQLLNISSSINPFIYGVTNRAIRREIKNILVCK